MKMKNHANKLETNAQIVSQNFGIGDASVVIEILRNRLYQHKIRTLVQEYICNARDAHREIHSTARLEVTLPTKFNPTFSVRDFGLGTSPERMERVFVLYGASTKRDNNTQTGGFGIGAKSAWSYTDSFTIVTYIDGVKRVYVAHTGVNNNGRLDLIETSHTKESSGTEIKIAVNPNDWKEFRNAALRATYFWDIRPKFKGINESEIPTREIGYRIGKQFEVQSNNLPSFVTWSKGYYNEKKDLLVIDGIPYPIDDELQEKIKGFDVLNGLINQSKFILYIDSGVVEVSASRESVADSIETVNALENLIKRLTLEVRSWIADQFGKVKSVNEFLTTYRTLKDNFNVEGFSKYDGYEINHYGNLNHKDLLPAVVTIKHVTNLDIRGRKVTSTIKRTQTTMTIDRIGALYQVDVEESKVIQNRRFRALFATNKYITLITPKSGSLSTQLIKDLGIKKLSSVIPIAVEREIKEFGITPKRKSDEICAHLPTSRGFDSLTVSVDQNEVTYIYEEKNTLAKLDRFELYDFAKYLKDYKDMVLIGLAPTSIAKIKSNPKFVKISTFKKKWTLTANELSMLKSQLSTHIYDIKKVLKKGYETIKDKEVKDLVKSYIDITNTKLLPKLVVSEFAHEANDFLNNERAVIKRMKLKYPLVFQIQDANMSEELVTYINAKN